MTLQEYMGFMINKETENVRSSEDIEMAFRALSKELRPYVTAEELYANLGQEQAEYCIKRMKPYVYVFILINQFRIHNKICQHTVTFLLNTKEKQQFMTTKVCL